MGPAVRATSSILKLARGKKAEPTQAAADTSEG